MESLVRIRKKIHFQEIFICHKRFSFLSSFRKHLEKEHDISNNFEKLEFKCFEGMYIKNCMLYSDEEINNF
jgi:hypothetical protein